ncbi:X-linked retinitis pigmentosa GTPase regulator-interacting protein 1, partial [Cichlidogyrus casuarinus]
ETTVLDGTSTGESLVKDKVEENTPEPVPRSRSLTEDGEADRIKLVLHWLTLRTLSGSPHIDLKKRQVFVEYELFGSASVEESPASRLVEDRQMRGQLKAVLDYEKTFEVDFKNNYEKRQFLASLLLPDDPSGGCLKLTVVSEPLPTDTGECEELGQVTINIREITKLKKDLDKVPLKSKFSLYVPAHSPPSNFIERFSRGDRSDKSDIPVYFCDAVHRI